MNTPEIHEVPESDELLGLCPYSNTGGDHRYEVVSYDDDMIVYVCRDCGAEYWDEVE